MDSIQRVVQRINNIEQRFAVQRNPGTADFSEIMLQTQQKKAEPMTYRAGASDITKMLHIAAQKHGIDPKLAVAVAQTESSFVSDAVSSAGAVGIMQLMPETAQAMGVRNLYDPRENIEGGVRYLKQMLTSFGGDVSKALAAYNAGPDAVRQYNGIPPYSETRDYVAKVLHAYNNS